MLIAFSPIIGLHFGYIPILIMSPLFLIFVNKSYQFYKKKAKSSNTSYIEALEKDLPDMSPVHFLLFFLIASPIFFIITGGELKGFIGIAILYIIYFIYYYFIKKIN